jgi:hypothetical protein
VREHEHTLRGVLNMNDLKEYRPTQAEWSWMRVYYFEACKDTLILDGVWPAVKDVCKHPGTSRAYFQRDWVGGPNILVGLGAADSRTLLSRVAVPVLNYLKAHPSQGVVSDRQLRDLSRSLANWEGRQPDTEVNLRPNNHVQIETQEPYSLLLRQDALKGAVRRFLSQSSAFAVEWLEGVRTGLWQRQHIALHIMIGAAWVADRNKLRSHLSFRSHAAGFLRVSDRSGQLGRLFASRYSGADGGAIRTFLEKAVEAMERGADSVAGMGGFLTLLRYTMSDLYQGLQQNRYQPAPASEVAGQSSQSEGIRRGVELLDASPALRAWQIMISLVYQTLNQLGMQPLQRFLACYLISRAAEDVYGYSADRISEDLYRTGDHNAVFSFFADQDRLSRAS